MSLWTGQDCKLLLFCTFPFLSITVNSVPDTIFVPLTIQQGITSVIARMLNLLYKN